MMNKSIQDLKSSIISGIVWMLKVYLNYLQIIKTSDNESKDLRWKQTKVNKIVYNTHLSTELFTKLNNLSTFC